MILCFLPQRKVWLKWQANAQQAVCDDLIEQVHRLQLLSFLIKAEHPQSNYVAH